MSIRLSKRRVLLLGLVVVLVLLFALLGYRRSEAAWAAGPVQIPILMYHHFVETEAEVSDPTMMVTTERFREHLSWFQEQGFTTIHLAELEAHLYAGAPLPPKPLVLTMDDGYRSNYELAFPILQEYGMKATIFTLAKYQDQPKPPTNLPSFSWAEAREMVASGLIDVQSHTYGLHRLDERRRAVLMTATDDEVRQDFAQVAAAFERELGYAPRYIAFPYGRYGEREVTLAQEAGLRLGLSTRRGCNTQGTHPWQLRRVTMSQKMTTKELERRLTPGGNWWYRLISPGLSC